MGRYLECKALVEKHEKIILETERYIWEHPETGFREWGTTRYLAKCFEDAGYELTMAGDVPGFYADLDTGRPGPRILILGEMDALIVPDHPEQKNGYAHACGHNTQCAALLGAALALKEPGALDGLCGSIRFMAVPAEELIEIEYRDSLRKQGIIHYLSGKTEFLYRGYMDGCDIAFMNHVGTGDKECFTWNDMNGCMAKTIIYKGVAAHAGGHPELGINALYAANVGMNAINALRETFKDNDHVRVHPIITAGGSSVNVIPSNVVMQSYVRGASIESIASNNDKVNRAIAGSALSLGAEVRVEDRAGYAPLINDDGLKRVMGNCAAQIFGENAVKEKPWGCGSTDMGDLSCVMRVLHTNIAGGTGHHHGVDFLVSDPYTACVTSAVVYVMTVLALLENEAKEGKTILAGPPLRYPNKEAFFTDISRLMVDRDMIKYGDRGAEVTW